MGECRSAERSTSAAVRDGRRRWEAEIGPRGLEALENDLVWPWLAGEVEGKGARGDGESFSMAFSGASVDGAASMEVDVAVLQARESVQVISE